MKGEIHESCHGGHWEHPPISVGKEPVRPWSQGKGLHPLPPTTPGGAHRGKVGGIMR